MNQSLIRQYATDFFAMYVQVSVFFREKSGSNVLTILRTKIPGYYTEEFPPILNARLAPIAISIRLPPAKVRTGYRDALINDASNKPAWYSVHSRPEIIDRLAEPVFVLISTSIFHPLDISKNATHQPHGPRYQFRRIIIQQRFIAFVATQSATFHLLGENRRRERRIENCKVYFSNLFMANTSIRTDTRSVLYI